MRRGRGGLAVFQQRRGPALHSSPQNAAASRPRSSFRRRPESRNHARRCHSPLAARTTAMLVPARLRQRHRFLRPLATPWIPAFAGMTGLSVGLVGRRADAAGVAGLGWISAAARTRTAQQPAERPASRPCSSFRRRPESRNHARHRHTAGRPHHGHAGSSAPSAAPGRTGYRPSPA